MAHCAVGLDFGTSNSAIGYACDGTLALHSFDNGKDVIPSALFYDEDEKSLIFGAEAEQLFLAGDDGRYMRALKSILGTGLVEETTRLGARSWPFRDLLARFLAFMKQDLERSLGFEVSHLVAGRPVRFVDNDKEKDAEAQRFLKDILNEIGFMEVTFLYEPIAALVDATDLMEEPVHVLVADIGGGTSDFSIARRQPSGASSHFSGFEILANHGVHVGGTDLDKQLSLDIAMPFFGYGSETRSLTSNVILPIPAVYFSDLATWQKIHLLYTHRTKLELTKILHTAIEPDKIARLLDLMDRRLGHQLAAQIERVKINLSQSEETTLQFSEIPGFPHPKIGRPRLANAISVHLARIRDAVCQTCDMAGLDPNSVDHVVLTGGSTILPAVRRAIADCVPKATIVSPDQFGGVAKGLTKAAKRLYG